MQTRIDFVNRWRPYLTKYLLQRTDDTDRVEQVLADVEAACVRYPKPIENHFILFQSAHQRLGATDDFRTGITLFVIGLEESYPI